VVVLSLSNLLYPTATANTAPNPIEIISITESSSTSVEILFNSNLPKKQLSYYVINAAVELPVAAPQSSKTQNVVAIAPKSIKKVIKTKASGLITAEIKNLNPKAAYNFSISAKTNKGKMINSAAVEYSPLSNLMDAISNLPADWGNPTQTITPIAAPAFTLSSSSESKVVNTAISGYSISSSGGAIASYSISPAAPAGLTFNTSTGLLAGTPTVVAVETTYTITATNATGSAAKTFTLTVAPTAPAFTLSSSTETRTKNTAATGFTINSTGGVISRFTINATPPGMSFNTTTGALTGTPNTVAAATNYTITAINVTGTAAQTFTLTVTAIVYAVGNLGPAGGRIIYVSADGFSCGPTRGGDGIPTATCKYLEAAPSGWFSGVVGGLDPRRPWAQSAPINYQMATVGETPRNIGYGLSNTLRIINQGNNNPNTSAAALANSYTVTVDGVTYNDWALPSRDELNQMCRWQRGNTVSNDRCAGGILNSGTGASGFPSTADGVVTYWSSTEATTFVGGAVGQDFGSNDVGIDNNRWKSENDQGIIRPVRAFQ
jgi:hypothetical protein